MIHFRKKNRYSKDIKIIRKYLNTVGELEATYREIEDAWADYSDKYYAAGWIIVDNTSLTNFAKYLEENFDE